MKLSGLLMGLGLLAGVGFLILEPWHSCAQHAAWTTVSFRRWHRGGSAERNAAASLKTITVAQVDFRSNDRDNNQINDFWRGDIAGLYGFCPRDSTEMVKLLEISVAGADAQPLDKSTNPPTPGKMTGLAYYATHAPKAGYWFRAIRHADEKDKLDTESRFAAVAYPADYPKSGRWTYVVDESNTIYKRDLGRPGGIDVYPTDEELKLQWAKID